MSDLPLRGGRVRRRGGPRRASRGFSPRRALAALAMLAAAGLVWGAVTSPAFTIETIEIEGAALTGEATVGEALSLAPPGPNAFTVPTDILRTRVRALPAVADAEVTVGLPGTLRVRVEERVPVLAWHRGSALMLVDRDGRVLADAAAPGATTAMAAVGDLPRVEDGRVLAPGPAVGDLVDPLDLDVATRLLAVTPADVGSSAVGLSVAVDDEDGWTLTPGARNPWTAVFGFYGPEIRVPTMIPEQVRLLRSLLGGRESEILRVVLAGEREGTFTERSGSGG